MHELSITENILQIALKHAEKAQADQIKNLYLVVGELSSIIDDSIQFYWSILAKDTIAEGASLHFRRLPMILQCKKCDALYSPENSSLVCPECQSEQISIIQGEEFYLEAIDIE